MKTVKDYIVKLVLHIWDRYRHDCLTIGLFFAIGVEML